MPSINGFELAYLRPERELLHTCGADLIFRPCPGEPSMHVGSCYSVHYEWVRNGSVLHPFSVFRILQNRLKTFKSQRALENTSNNAVAAYPVEWNMGCKRDEKMCVLLENSL